jgi:hypothetical protein
MMHPDRMLPCGGADVILPGVGAPRGPQRREDVPD